MGFVRTDEELAEIRERMETNEFRDSRSLTVRFETTEVFVERVLPPGLDPADPLAEVNVHEVGESNCVGGFAGGALYVRARHGDREGKYCLAMPMSTDAAITWGRELFGEPKKRAAVTFEKDGPDVRGRIERHGETVVDLRGDVTDEREGGTVEETVFHYKYLPDPTGDGLQFDPLLVGVAFENETRRLVTGSGTAELRSTAHDAFGDVPVEETLGAAYAETDMTTSQETLATVDAEAFLPYAYGTGAYDDWLAMGA
ncbi:MAG: acetoacetate decarboxylase family protein [Haloarculaceae archaeon]